MASQVSSTCSDELSPEEQALVVKVWNEGARLYRDLPWRNVDDPYAVMVSEIMLQQTQVARVEKYWQRFMALFPTLDALASAETSLVLEMWQGLGYNRRALALKRTAEICSREFNGLLVGRVASPSWHRKGYGRRHHGVRLPEALYVLGDKRTYGVHP